MVPVSIKVSKTISLISSPLQTVRDSTCWTWAVGRTLIVNSFDGPSHCSPLFVNVGITSIVAVRTSKVLFSTA